MDWIFFFDENNGMNFDMYEHSFIRVEPEQKFPWQKVRLLRKSNKKAITDFILNSAELKEQT